MPHAVASPSTSARRWSRSLLPCISRVVKDPRGVCCSSLSVAGPRRRSSTDPTWRSVMSRNSTLTGLTGILVCTWLVALAGDDASERLRTDRPVVKVLAPPGVAYFMHRSEDEKVVVVIEIIDATRQGLK